MDNVNYFKDLLEEIPDYKNIVLLLFLIKKDDDLLHEIGFSERDITRSSIEFKNLLTEQHQEYLQNKKMKKNLYWKSF